MRIGLFLNNLDEEYQISIYRNIRAEAGALSLDLICVQGETLYNYAEESGGEPFPSRQFIGVDGILILASAIMNYTEISPLPVLQRFIQVPAVSIGSRLSDYPSIIVRNRRSMSRLMEHLIVLHGYRKLLYLGGPVQHPDNLVREHIFRRTVNTLKKEFPGLEGKVINGEFHQTSAMMMVRNYINLKPEEPPEVIVAANDNIALGALELLHTQKDPRWRDCPVTGFDDIDQARLEVPALTTIRQPLDELGRLAVRALWDLMRGKKVSQVIYTESELRIRNSCGCASTRKTGEKKITPDNPGGTISKSEYHLQNVSLLGQALVTIDSLGEMFTPLRFFLTNLAVKSFYLVLYPRPLEYIGETGRLIYRRTESGEVCMVDNSETLEMRDFFSNVITTYTSNEPRAWCVYYLRSGREFLGLIVYEASDRVHPQMCSAAIFLANTVKRLQIHEDEKEQSLRLEREVAVRTKDLGEEIHRRMEVEAEVLRISEMERLRFSMDLHDDICQRLAGISMFCKSLIHTVSPQTFLPELSELIDETLTRTRRYAHDSFPVELDTMGLKEAMSSLCHTITKQGSFRCNFSWSGPEKSPFGPAQDLNIYRIAQEALQNAVKHAGADMIDVEIIAEKAVFSVAIRDNGTGGLCSSEETPNSADAKRYIKRGGLGMRSMRYRAHQLGAEYIFESSEQDGTRVEIRIPFSSSSRSP